MIFVKIDVAGPNITSSTGEYFRMPTTLKNENKANGNYDTELLHSHINEYR